MSKILIINYKSASEMILLSPVLRCVNNQIENAEIHILTFELYRDLLEQQPFLAKIHTFSPSKAIDIKYLKQERFDYIFDFQNDFRSTGISFSLKTKTFTLNRHHFKKWLLVRFKKNLLPKKHLVEQYFDCIQNFPVKNDNQGLDYFIEMHQEINLLKLPGDFPYGFVVFCIGAENSTLKLPREKIISICQQTSQKIILLGGNEEKENANLIELSCRNVYNACGKYSVNQMASLIRQARVVITHDNYLMHIASAYKKRIVSIWGSSTVTFGKYPYLSDEKSLVVQIDKLSCRPCSTKGLRRCPKKHFACMQAIDAEKIAQLIDWLAMPAFIEDENLIKTENVQTPE